MARRLKVFTWSDGFHVWTVAASSRAKALEAWGFERDLFKDGSAREITEGEDYDRAQAQPGEPIKRGLTVDVGQVETMRKPSAKKVDAARDAGRKRIAALEVELQTLDEIQAAEAADLDARREALEREAATLAARHKAARDKLKARLKAARDEA
jgi:FtsZ-binding cell division protein ZapB